MKKFSILAVGLLLAACDPTPEQQAAVRSGMPAGCSIRNLGRYGDIDNLVVVFCDGRRASITQYTEQHGKTHNLQTTLVVE